MLSCPSAALTFGTAAQQVKGQSEMLSTGYSQLQAAHAALEQQQAALAGQQAAAQAERKAAKVERQAAEAASRAAAEARLAAAAEQRKLGQERLESLRAAEVVRELQLRLAAHVRRAVAAGVPRADEVWQQLGAAVGAEPLPGAPAPNRADSRPSAEAPPAVAASVPTAVAAAPAQGVRPGDDASRYRAVLADLESSIDRWRGQLRAGEALTFTAGGSNGGLPYTPGCLLGGASFFLPPAAAVAASSAATPTAGPSKGRVGSAKRVAAAAAAAQEEQADGSDGSDGEEEELEEGEAWEVQQPRSPSRAVQTAVLYLDAPRAYTGKGASSVPGSPARQRSGMTHGAAAPRPASASAAVQRSGGSGSSSPGDVWAVQGLTLAAEYSVAGSPLQHSKPRKWFKGGDKEAPLGAVAAWAEATQAKHSSGDLDGCGGKGWGGIFAFRRSVDGSGGGSKR